MPESARHQPEINFSEPSEFVYANSYRTYGSAVDITIEFGRSRPISTPAKVEVAGVVGVIMGIEPAKQLVLQLQEAIQRAEQRARAGAQLAINIPSSQ